MSTRRIRHLPAATPEEHATAAALRRHVVATAKAPRNLWHLESLQRTAAYIDNELRQAGYDPRHQTYEVEGRHVANIEAERKGNRQPARIVVIGAHYDSVGDSPGANDNASGVAVMLELARAYAVQATAASTVRFVAFVNEEPPYFMTPDMGSFRYAAEAAARGDDVVGMMSLETIGYYTEVPGSQRYPLPGRFRLPDRGNFLAMVSNLGSVRALRAASKAFRSATRLPLLAAPAPAWIPGIAWSDHWSFWEHGYRAIMLTDTAPYRYPHYHLSTDTPERLDYEKMAQVVAGCAAAIRAWSA
jgi:Zn-dependent M28 family amino/carboxypeptidase